MGQRQIFNPARPLQIRDLNEMFRELFESAYESKRDAAGFARLSGITMQGAFNANGFGLTNFVAVTGSNGNSGGTYPAGFSYAAIDGANYAQDSGEDFPRQTGLLVTVKHSEIRCLQALSHKTSGELWVRAYASDAGGFQPWGRVLTSATGGKLLWSGSWSSGSITVPGTGEYSAFLVRSSADVVDAIVTKPAAGALRGAGGYWHPSMGELVCAFAATYSGNVWTFGRFAREYHTAGAGHSAETAVTVTGIYGLV